MAKIKNLFLVAPVAYGLEAGARTTNFGDSFKKLITQSNGWLHSEALKTMHEKITADVLVVRFEYDKSDRKHMANAFYASAKRNGKNRRQMVTLDYAREQALTRPIVVHDIVASITNFLAGR